MQKFTKLSPVAFVYPLQKLAASLAVALMLAAPLISLAQSAPATTQQQPHAKYVQKSPNKIKVNATNSNTIVEAVKQGKAYLVDVRTPEEYNQQHLQYALNINLRSANFASQLKQLSTNKIVYLYCHSGNRSAQATDSLLVLGYAKAYNIGGIDSLLKAGLPLAITH